MANENENKRYQVNHYHSLDKTANGEAVAPAAADLGEGEIALNLAKGVETLYVKNGEDEVIATPLGTREYDSLKNQLEEIAQVYSIYGMARVNGEGSPAGTIFFGEEVNFKQIANIVHLGLVNQEGKLYKRCANCRVDKSVDGVDMAIDGSDGDVLLYIDRTVYVCRFTDVIEGVADGAELNVFAVGLAPFSIYGHPAKAIKPFAFSPQYTVNAKLTKTNNGDGVNGVEDVRTCAHSIYNKNVAGTHTAANGTFKTGANFKPNGNGFPSQYVSSMDSIWYGQCKNPDEKTNRPFMGGYYEFTEIILMLMYLENHVGGDGKSSLYHQALDNFGCGSTMSSIADNTNFCTESMAGNSGVKVIVPGETPKVKFLGLMSGSAMNTTYPLAALVGTTYYGFTEMLETQRLLSDIAKANLVNKIWKQSGDDTNKSVIFEYDADGNIILSSLTVADIASGTGMVVGKKYYQVRNTKTCQGMSEGVMTAVANVFVKFEFNDNVKCGEDVCTNGIAIFKFSHAVYRGMSLSFEGMFTQMQGCHYVRVHRASDDKIVSYFIAAEDVESVPAQQSASIEYFGDEDAELAMEAGLTKKVMNHGPLPASHTSHYGWAGKADYNMSLFCLVDDDLNGESTKLSGSISTKECSFLWNYASWSNGDSGTLNGNGTPRIGRKCVNAVVVGCHADNDDASARTVDGNVAVRDGYVSCAGRFSLPHLTF